MIFGLARAGRSVVVSGLVCALVLLMLPLYVLSVATNAHAQGGQNILAPGEDDAPTQVPSNDESLSPRQTLRDMIHALDVMQDAYFEQWIGTWPDAIDWTAAVLGTQVSAALSALTVTPSEVLLSTSSNTLVQEALAYENLINRYFDQVSAFYFGENAFSLRMQAFDDMLWVVLGWLESIKFQNLHSDLHYASDNATFDRPWHGAQLRVPAAHRARLFYELASNGWDTELCDGGMVWSPYLFPYKNAITNELFISASIGMYLYFTGDPINAPFLHSGDDCIHDPAHLSAAVRAYQWLKNSNMTGFGGLYADGFHIRGYKGVREPGTKKCDQLNTMVYTYNQGVVLSGLRGLWIATTEKDYLRDGHALVDKVIRATGWPNTASTDWAGLGRGGVLEEICDAYGDCSQNGHTFKGIFFHHLAEFCRPLRPEEERLLVKFAGPRSSADDAQTFLTEWHLARCRRYRDWIRHNAQAALMTRNEEGKFGMWWGRRYPSHPQMTNMVSSLPYGAVDYSNHGDRADGADDLAGLLRAQSNQPPEGADHSVGMKMDSRRQGHGRPYQEPFEQRRITRDVNDRGRGRTVESQSGGLAVVRAWYQWQIIPSLR